MKAVSTALLLAGVMLTGFARGQDPAVKLGREVLLGPPSEDEAPVWLAAMRHWREEHLAKMHYSGAEYDRPELKWTQRSFIQTQMMVEDRYFYDPAAGKYTVDRYLDDLERRYGGIDSVLVWAVYCNIGIDWRNQHDMVRALPGGLAGVRQMVADFHRRGVKVLFPAMPWDVGTRDEGEPLWTAIARTLKEVGADGVNGDTFRGIPKEFRTASDETGHILAFEPEVGLNGESELPWNNMSWGYWTYNFIPTVSRYKWLEPRHMVNVCNRWARDHTDDLQHAFFNGTGFESWENIWGIWNGLTPRDAEAVRRLATIERACALLLTSSGWEPHYHTLQAGVFASKFPGERQTVWTLVNRTEYDIPGPQLRLPHETGRRYFDLWHGVELTPVITTNLGVLSADLGFEIEGHGYGAVLAWDKGSPDASLAALLARMSRLSRKPLQAFSSDWQFLPQKQAPIKPVHPPKAPPRDMVHIPGGTFEFVVSGIMVEGGDKVGVDVQYPWEDSPRRHHRQRLTLKPFWIDRYPVTNARFKVFLEATGYRPRDGGNYLRDWKEGTYPSGWGNKPVTLGVAGRCACLRPLGGQTPAARMGMAIRGARGRPAPVPLGQRRERRCRAAARHEPQPAPADGCGCVSNGCQSVWRDGYGGQRMAVDGRIPGRAHPHGCDTRWKLLLSAGLQMVFPQLQPADGTRQAVVNGLEQRPGGDVGLPLCHGRGVSRAGRQLA